MLLEHGHIFLLHLYWLKFTLPLFIRTLLILPTAEEQWNNNYQDFGPENFAGMPLGPQGGFNSYWGGGMPLPIDYMGAPFPGPMPYMGYPPPGPFDPFGGGVIPQDPFMPPAYMMPTVPRYTSSIVLMFCELICTWLIIHV